MAMGTKVMTISVVLLGLSWLCLSTSTSSSSTSSGVQYSVGDSLWTIPPYPYYFSNWSSSHHFNVGDSLVFDFETGRYDVIQVTRLDYELCTVWNPIRIFYGGPAIVQLTEPGVFFFICNFSNYCDLGLKISVTVHGQPSNPPSPSPSPSPMQPRPVLVPSPTPGHGDTGSPQNNAHRKSSSEAIRVGFVGGIGLLLFVVGVCGVV